MTIEELSTYKDKKRLLGILTEQVNQDSLKGFDFSKVSVQGGKDSDPTSENARKNIENSKLLREKIEKLKSDILKVQKFIVHISDPKMQEIVIRFSIYGETFTQIGNEMFMDRTTVSKKLRSYLKHSRNSRF